MNKLLYKTGTGVAVVALIAQGFAGLAFAGIDVTVSGNGANSNNKAEVEQKSEILVTQTNDANITNNVDVDANTGGNDSNGNTGGDVKIDTGDSTAEVGISNNANSNTADVSGCCPSDLSATISGNGAKSKNEAEVEVKTKTWVIQNNDANVRNNVDVDLDTGNNDANRNTGGDVTVKTGDAAANGGVQISNAVNQNIASIGNGSGNGSLAVVISGNGAKSDNKAEIEVESEKGVVQINNANITNKVDVDADTGYNDANANTNGDVLIDTGDATANVLVSNMANFNAVDLESCGCILDGTVKVKNNGAKSENKAEVELKSGTFATQVNNYSCGPHHPWGDGGPFPILLGGRGHHSRSCNDVGVDLDTGNNDANRNGGELGGDPTVKTGDASADVVVETNANSNQVGSADFNFDLPDVNGSSSLLFLLLAFFS